MSKIKHTPTWRAYESAGFKGEWGVETDDPAKVATGDEIIVYPSLSEADARLIAAAPDLLEALKDAASLIERNGFREWTGGSLAEIRAAIAKAEGRS